jgi:hypothetical protein
MCDSCEKVTELLNSISNIAYIVSLEDLNESVKSLATSKGIELFTFEEAKSIGRQKPAEPNVFIILFSNFLFIFGSSYLKKKNNN